MPYQVWKCGALETPLLIAMGSNFCGGQLIGFTLSDLYAEPFTYKNGDKAGETGVSLKARLLR